MHQSTRHRNRGRRRGHIAGPWGSDASLEILVVMPDGQDWFPRALFYDHFATTGLNIHR